MYNCTSNQSSTIIPNPTTPRPDSEQNLSSGSIFGIIVGVLGFLLIGFFIGKVIWKSKEFNIGTYVMFNYF